MYAGSTRTPVPVEALAETEFTPERVTSNEMRSFKRAHPRSVGGPDLSTAASARPMRCCFPIDRVLPFCALAMRQTHAA